MALQFRVNESGGDTFCPALEGGLARSGMTVSSDASADLSLTCHAFFSEDDGLFRVQVNGQTRMRVQVRVEVRSAQGALVDTFIAEYKGYRGGPPDEDAIAKIVNSLAYAPRIAAFARAPRGAYVATTAAATVSPPPPFVRAPMQSSNARDDSEWFGIDTVKCKIPARVEACDAVRRYLQHHPDGAHADEANQLLAAAQPALEKLQKDEVAWQKAHRDECATRRTSDACVGVEAYEIQFPSGVHADDAHRLLKAAGVDK